MKRSIFILVSAMAIFVVTLMITNRYMSDETMHEADVANELQIQEVTRRMDLNLFIREKAVHSFLSGIFYYDIQKGTDGSDTLIYIRDAELSRFKDYVYESLNDFVKLNPHTHSAAFLIDPSVYPEKGENGFAPLVVQSDSVHKNIVDMYDFVHAKSYQEVTRTGHCQWRIPSPNSSKYGSTLLYYVPIKCQNGSVFGAFVINVSLDVLRSGLAETLPYGADNSFILAVDNKDNIIFSTDTFPERFKSLADFSSFVKSIGTYKEVTTGSVRHDEVSWYGQDYCVYSRTLSHAPWEIITVCNKGAIYDSVTKTRNVILIVSLIGMLLMLVCCTVVFLQVKNQLTKRAAAEGEIKLAANVQKSLLKASSYSMNQGSNHVQLDAFIRPAREAGGDLYDFIERDGKLIFCIGDVSGKGMPAALFMTQVVSLFRNAATSTDQPELMASQINNVLVMNNPEMTFCTMFIGVYDVCTRLLTFCNAGHNRPVMENGVEDGTPGTRFLPVKPNLAVGLMEDFPYRAENLTINEGDTLLLYTDGVTEAMNAKHELFGNDNLLAAAKTPTIESVTKAVDTFVNGCEQSDDITIMTVSFG